MLGPILALGIPLLIAAAAFIYHRVTLDGPRAPIVVVDRRTMRLATRRIEAAVNDGHIQRADAGLVSLINWLDGEIRHGARRHRQRYADSKKFAEDYRAELRAEMGMTELPGR